MAESKGAMLRRLLNEPDVTLMPFGALPIHAQMAQKAGFQAFEISGAMTSFWVGGSADVGYLTMTEVVQHAASVARAVDIPVYCDADTGYGAPWNVRRTTHELIRAGIAGMHIEDQKEPKKAGSKPGIELVSDEEALGRLRAALDARDEMDPDFVIVARTDGYTAAGGSLEEAIRRGNLYKQAGADAIFYEGLHSWDEVRTAIAATEGPTYAIASNRAGRTPSVAELTAMGQAMNIVRFATPGIQEVWNLLLEVKESGEVHPIDDYHASQTKYAGTPKECGHGDMFVTPSYQDVQEMERKYLPPELQRDYLNNTNAGE